MVTPKIQILTLSQVLLVFLVIVLFLQIVVGRVCAEDQPEVFSGLF